MPTSAKRSETIVYRRISSNISLSSCEPGWQSIDSTRTSAEVAMDLAGRRVLVTGASRNLGTTICERFADVGMSVALNYHSTREPAEELAAALRERTGTRHAAVAGDVTDA